MMIEKEKILNLDKINEIVDFKLLTRTIKKLKKVDSLNGIQLSTFIYGWLQIRGYSMSNFEYTENFLNARNTYLESEPKLSLHEIIQILIDNDYIKKVRVNDRMLYEIL